MARRTVPQLGALAGAALGLATVLAGCAATPGPAPVSATSENASLPGWFVEREAKLAAAGQPDLAAAPKADAASDAARSAEFDRIARELTAAQADMARDARAAGPAAPGTAEALDQEARDAIERARR